jgi:hypothetical protein
MTVRFAILGVVYPDMSTSKCTIAIVEGRWELQTRLGAAAVCLRVSCTHLCFRGGIPRERCARVACVPDPRYSAAGDVRFRVIRPSHRVWPISAGDLHHRAGRGQCAAPSVPDSQQCLPAEASCRRRAAGGRPFAAWPQQFRCGEPRNMRPIAMHSSTAFLLALSSRAIHSFPVTGRYRAFGPCLNVTQTPGGIAGGRLSFLSFTSSPSSTSSEDGMGFGSLSLRISPAESLSAFFFSGEFMLSVRIRKRQRIGCPGPIPRIQRSERASKRGSPGGSPYRARARGCLTVGRSSC